MPDPVSRDSFPSSQGPRGSVLVPLGFNAQTGVTNIVLTKRTQTVETHKGQVSFPGGLVDSGDKTVEAAAFRECYEEIGLPSDRLTPMGSLEPVATRGALVVYSFVAKFTLPFEFKPNPNEVDKILLLPVQRLMTEGLSIFEISVEEFEIKTPGIYVENELVWGATARILQNLKQQLALGHFLIP